MKNLACTSCRQDKLKCDAATSPTPGICSRCKKLKKSCISDPNFKRISKKTQVQQLKKELKIYKHALISGSTAKLATAASTAAAAAAAAAKDSNNDNTSNNNVNVGEITWPCSSDKTLGMIVLPVDKINQLFKIFFDHCHQYLSFTISRSVEDIYSDCPLLFWVICYAASVSDQPLHQRLYPPVQRLVSEVTLYPARQVETVQALLIASLWPFPSTSLLADSSYLLSGIAIHIGLQIGLHRSEYSHEFNSKPEVLKVNADVRKETWLSCFLVDFWHSTKLGVPSTFVQDLHFISTIENPATAESLSRKCRLCRLTSAACTALGADTSSSNVANYLNYESRVNMIKMYIKELTALQMNSSSDPPTLEVMFLGSRLQIFSFALVEMSSNTNDGIGSGEYYNSIEIFYQAEMDAIKLIDLVHEEVDTQYAPVYIPRLVIYSTLILLWILKSKYTNNKQQITQSISIAQEVLTKLNRYEQDEPERAISLIYSFSKSNHDKRKIMPIRSRMSATLLYESIRMSKEYSNDIIQRLVDSLLNTDDLSSAEELNL